MHKKLFIPGPVDVRPEILEAFATPMIGHRTKDISALQERISMGLQKLFFTENTMILSTSSGTGLMEGAVRSFTGRRVLVFSVGAFGNRWAQLAEGNGVPVDKVEVTWGMPTLPEVVDEYLATGKYDVFTVTHNETSTGVMNDLEAISVVRKKYPNVFWLVDAVSSMGGAKIEVDKLGIDVCITSTQKCLGLPPGMSVASVSDKAIEYAKGVKNRGCYFDYVELYKFVKEKPYQYPSTPSIPHMYGLDKQLDYILNQEGLEKRFNRHAAMAETVRKWAVQKGFEILAAEGYRSNTVTTIRNTKGISIADLNKSLGQQGYSISNGYGALKEKTFRIAHMADRQPEELQALLDILSKEIK
ncbi:MAG: alanine--glyoxylate aminotransferase family protein [Candidatus Neomarinimicrobiota bacterium]|jgi:predicted phosphoserine aminotransferase|nr:alanine--glyoxylate aminotransferase family protein [Candidatus Neomarinimicrobiota bacterium]MDX9780672.1 alanine--glyoxylate aminotransferase family protein [bacterium]